MNTRLRITVSLAAAGLLAAGFQTAHADPGIAKDKQTVSRTVIYRDLDLRTQTGKRVLQDRLLTAASDVCYEVVGKHYGYMSAHSHCRVTLAEDALARVYRRGDITVEELAATHKSGEITLAGGPAP
jgi:UrcA family protein